jgi:lipopolysaccharide/colanic/teichoic acid biosynthesis glycosyltransferase
LRVESNINTNFVDFAKSEPTIKVDSQLNGVVHYKKHFNIILNILIYSLTLSFFYFNSQNSFNIDNEYLISSGLFLFSIFIGALLSGKFKLTRQDKSEQIVKSLSLSLAISLIFLVIIFFSIDITRITRLAILSAAFSGLAIELFYFIVLNHRKENEGSHIKRIKLPLGYILLDGLLLTLFCYFEVANNIIPFHYGEKEFLLIVLIYLSWVISAATTHKFIPTEVSTSRMNAFELQVKFYLGIILLTTLSMIFLQIEFLIALNFIKALAGYSFVSSLLSILLFARKIKNKSDEATVVFLKAYEMKDVATRSNGRNGNGRYSYFSSETETLTQQHKIEFDYLKEYGNVFSILDTILELKSFDARKTLVLKSDQPNDITTQQLNSFELVVNLQVLNDQVKLNDYLFEVRDILLDKGVFVGALLPHHYRYRRYLKKYSFNLANLLYFFDFIWKRVMPKLPVTREIYFTFSKEKDRAISLAEGLGRLVYCGFKVLDLVAIDDVVYFAAVKSENQIPDKKFFYSPIFKMKRIGKDGRPIYVYKFRTMYPYSEFIQDFVYNHNKLEAGGKFKDDFRVPAWGRLFRKLWIDELPMLINWLKGDLKFVGVRPISNQYLTLYSKEHQERRKNFKPGLVPPFYADMPKSIEEIELSEKQYLDAYEINPVKTDFNYFIKAVNNILIKHKRSA